MPEMPEGHPRRVLLRASLHQATVQGAELQAPARSIEAGDGQQAIELLRAISDAAPPNPARVTDWAHGNAGFWLRDIGGGEKAFWYTKEQLLWAAASCAAGFQISRMFELSSTEQFVLRF